MHSLLSRTALASSALVIATAFALEDSHTLPFFFFHGLTANATFGDNLKANLSTESRPFVALTCCQAECSLGELNHQGELAIAQIREIGGALARLVIEQMDDHKVHTFISLAGAGNGIFYGPQENDLVPAKVFLDYFAPFTDPAIYDYSNYTDADITNGKLQLDMVKFEELKPEHQGQLTRSPNKQVWIDYNTFYPILNNLAPAVNASVAAGQARRKNNFLKLKEAHYFGSKFDETISPWQSALNGQYEDVGSMAELENKFKDLQVIPMTATEEYVKDLYGLQTLDNRGGLLLHEVDNVAHECWVKDSLSPRDGNVCKFAPVFEKNLYPLLAPIEATRPHC